MKWVCLIAVSAVMMLADGRQALSMTNEETAHLAAERTKPDYWSTDRARLLDSEAVWEFIAKVPLNQRLDPERTLEPEKPKPSTDETAAEIVKILMAELATERGVHIETTLTTLGALAGFAVQMGLREGPIAAGKVSEQSAFLEVETKDGQLYYTGDLINEGIIAPRQGQLSVWAFACHAASSQGKKLPDIKGIFARVARTLGTDQFGVPDLPSNHLPAESAEILLQKYWNIMRNILIINRVEPLHWPFVLGMAIRNIILAGQVAIDPGLAAQVVMEAAVPMSRIDPNKIFRAYSTQRD